MLACLSLERGAFLLHRLRTHAQLGAETPQQLCSRMYREAAYNNALDICAALVADKQASLQFAALALKQSKPYQSKGEQH